MMQRQEEPRGRLRFGDLGQAGEQELMKQRWQMQQQIA